jgi:hypothetical protein
MSDTKSPVLKFGTPGSVAGLMSNCQFYANAAICLAQRQRKKRAVAKQVKYKFCAANHRHFVWRIKVNSLNSRIRNKQLLKGNKNAPSKKKID